MKNMCLIFLINLYPAPTERCVMVKYSAIDRLSLRDKGKINRSLSSPDMLSLRDFQLSEHLSDEP